MEPLPVFEQAEAGEIVVRRLGSAVVHHKAVQAAGQCNICNALDIARVISVCTLVFAVYGKRFGRGDVLPVNMCNRSAFTYVGYGRCQH